MAGMFLVGRIMGRCDVRLLITFGLVLMSHSLYTMSGFTADVPQSMIVMTGLEQGFGLGFVFVPMSTIAFSTLPPALRTEGAGIFSLARNIGSAIGISIFATLLEQSTQRNHAEIATYVSPFNRMLSSSTIAGLTGPGAGPLAAALDGQVTREAVMIAYIDDFKAMMLVALLLFPLVLLLRTPRRPVEPGSHTVID